MRFIKNFSELSKQDVSIAGGKGASLGEMTRAGILVPSGFVVLTAAFDHFMRISELEADIDSLLHSVKHDQVSSIERASEQIRALILAKDMPEDICTEVLSSFDVLGSPFVAVRSSATSEDGIADAWAGQLESFLNTSQEQVMEQIKKCWASLFTPRAIFYRKEKQIHERISVAVVVQSMVESEVSGIAFSAHPISQDRNQIVIEAGYGLGEAIVSGQITPDNYVVEKMPRSILETNIHSKNRGLYRKQTGGNEWREISELNASVAALTQGQVLELSDIVVQIESHYHFPCDIEWAFADGKFYIVQSRPITTLRDSLEKASINIGLYSDYQTLFQVGGMPYLISDIFSEHYRSLKCLLLFQNNLWTSLLPRPIVLQTLADGQTLYSDPERFSAYKKAFEAYKISAKAFFERALKEDLSRDQLHEFLHHAAQLFIFYSKTEFFYTDQAFLASEGSAVLKENLKQLESVKNEGREYLNKIYFGSDGYLNQYLEKIGHKFNFSLDTLIHYSRSELLSLFEDKKVQDQFIQDRKYSYIIQAQGNEVMTHTGQIAFDAIERFMKQSVNGKSELKGICANKGKAKGKVKVLFSGYDNFDTLAHAIDAMNQGDILVAETTSPELILACHKASAIVTNQGGLMSHAAIVSREMGIPCVVGTGNATKILKDGDLIEVDGESGEVRLLNT